MFKKNKLRKALIIFIFIGLLVFLYGSQVSPKKQAVRHETVRIDGLPTSWENAKIAFFSDLNFGSNFTIATLKQTVEQINETKPDIVLFAGPLFDASETQTPDKTTIQAALSALKAPLGKFALLPEQLQPNTLLAETTDILTGADFQIIKDELRPLYRYSIEPLHLLVFSPMISNEKKTELLAQTTDTPTLLIDANTENFNNIATHPSLQFMFSYNTYGGFIGVPYINKKLAQTAYPSGFYRKDNQTLLVSNGLGTPANAYFRLFNKPSVYIVTIQQRR